MLPDYRYDNQAIDAACNALAMVQLGSLEDNQDMIVAARSNYALSLNYLSSTLSTAETANQDSTLATMLILGLCEVRSYSLPPCSITSHIF